MQQTMYMNKCRVCGTTVVLPKKVEVCAACGSDSITCSKHGEKEIDIAAIVKRVVLFILAGAALVGLIGMFL